MIVIDFIKSVLGKVMAFFGYLFGALGIKWLLEGDLISGGVMLLVFGLLPVQYGRRLQKKQEYFSGVYAGVDQALVSELARLARLNGGRLTALEAGQRTGRDLDRIVEVLGYLEQQQLARRLHVKHMDDFAEVYDFPGLLSAEAKQGARGVDYPGQEPRFGALGQALGKIYELLRVWRGAQEREMLNLVAAHDGRITMMDLLCQSTIPHNLAQMMLDHYQAKRIAVRQAVDREGFEVTVYAFPGTIGHGAKGKARAMSETLMAHEKQFGDADDLADALLKESDQQVGSPDSQDHTSTKQHPGG
ncbi:MAG: hypothetical protein HQL53_02240 [Magnetococcales bacterium]|nr:hypothetical protein [Magnetococcales bacterium]